MAKGQKWVDVLKEWEERGQGESGADDGLGAWRKSSVDLNGGAVSGQGYMGSLPPGLHEPPPVKDMLKRDYSNSWPAVYLLRPEVIMKFWIRYPLMLMVCTSRFFRLLRACISFGRRRVR